MDEVMDFLMSSPETTAEYVKTMCDKLWPSVQVVMDSIYRLRNEYLSTQEQCDLAAAIYRRKYISYTSAGFTSDQAMALILSEVSGSKEALSMLKGAASK